MRLNYDKDIKKIVDELNKTEKDDYKIAFINKNGLWKIFNKTDIIFEGTLRECYSCLIGICYSVGITNSKHI